MPSMLSRVTKRATAGPKALTKAVSNVRKSITGKNKKQASFADENASYNGADLSMTVAAYAPATSTRQEESMDLTNSVMIKADKHELSALREDSFMEREQQETKPEVADEIKPLERDGSMDTFIEESEEEDSLLEEKAREPSSSPINFVAENSMIEHKKIEEEEGAEEQNDNEALDVEEEEKLNNTVVSEKTIISETPVAAPVVIAPSVEEVKPVVVASVAPAVTFQSVVPVKSDVKKSEVFQVLKQTNTARPSSSIGSIRARFETGNSKPSPTTFKSVLAARNNAKFAQLSNAAAAAKREELAAPVVVETVKIENVEIVETEAKVAEVAAKIDEPVAQVAEKIEEPVLEVEVAVPAPLVEEIVTPAPVAESKVVVAVSSKTASLASGEEKAMHDAMMEIAAKPYKDQAVWFLNAYWNETFKDNTEACERVWRFCNKFTELDSQGTKGCELDELRAHRVLEVLAEALTITEMRTKFHGRARHVSLIELLIFVYGADWIQVVTAPQGSDEAKEQMLQAEALMEKCSAAFAESREKAKVAAEDEKLSQQKAKLALESKEQAVSSETQATEAERRAIESEAEATKRAEEAAAAVEAAATAAIAARAAEAETVARADQCAKAELDAKTGQEQAAVAETRAVQDEKQAREAESDAFRQEEAARVSEKHAMEAEKSLIDGQARVEAALLKVKEEEAAFHALLEELKQRSENTSLGLVVRRTASHEREVLLAKNPDPLNRARIAEEAVVRKHEKLIRQAAAARAAAGVARENSEKARVNAVAARGSAEDARAEAAIRRSAAETKVAAAEEARKLSEIAKETATAARQEAENTKKASDEALESAREAQDLATAARQLASQGKGEAAEFRRSAEQDEEKALAAQKLAEESRKQAEEAVVDAAKAVDRARSFVERVRKQASSGQGGWWWASRELDESKRYVPQKMLKKMAELEASMM